HPWLVKSTLQFWFDVQDRNNGAIPREVRKINLKSLWFPDHIRLGQPKKQNLTYANPYLLHWVAEFYYRYQAGKVPLRFVLRVIQSIERYVSWVERTRSVRNAKGELIGFSTNALGSGLDNSRGSRGNRHEQGSERATWVDMLALQISMYKSLSRWTHRMLVLKVEGADVPSGKNKWRLKCAAYRKKVSTLERLLRTKYWNEKHAFFFDLVPTTPHGSWKQDVRFHSIAGFWPLFSGSLSEAQLKMMVRRQFQPRSFGGRFPFPANARHALVSGDAKDDGYWDKWAHWPSMATIVLHGLRKKRPGLAHKLSKRFLSAMSEVSTQTVAEFYGEYKDKEGKIRPRIGQHGAHKTRLDFAGWGKVPPVLNMLHDVVGVQPLLRSVRGKVKRTSSRLQGHILWRIFPMRDGERLEVRNLAYAGKRIDKMILRKVRSGHYVVDVHAPMEIQFHFALFEDKRGKRTQSTPMRKEERIGVGKQKQSIIFF
ncbi:MAG: trehalase family glycosidase, partial [Myxococcota bacterium]